MAFFSSIFGGICAASPGYKYKTIMQQIVQKNSDRTYDFANRFGLDPHRVCGRKWYLGLYINHLFSRNWCWSTPFCSDPSEISSEKDVKHFNKRQLHDFARVRHIFAVPDTSIVAVELPNNFREFFLLCVVCWWNNHRPGYYYLPHIYYFVESKCSFQQQQRWLNTCESNFVRLYNFLRRRTWHRECRKFQRYFGFDCIIRHVCRKNSSKFCTQDKTPLK